MKLKYLFLLGFLGVLSSTAWVRSQTTSFETDFSNPAGDNGNWSSIDENANPHEYIFTIANGELTINYDKKSWHFIQLWIKPFDITVDPYFSFTAKADKNTGLQITLKDNDGNTVIKNVSLTTTYQYFYFNLQEDLSTFTSPLNEIQFSPPYGDAAGVIYFDDLKLGTAAKTSYSPPTIDQAPDLTVWDTSGENALLLTGITDGGEGLGQTVSITAVSDNPSLIPDPVLHYVSPADTATLFFSPQAGQQGTATITVTVSDDGPVENTTTMTFHIRVLAYGGTGFTIDFTGSAPDEWIAGTPGHYTFAVSQGEMIVNCQKLGAWSSFYHDLDKIYDLSSAPYLNVVLQTKDPFVLQAYLHDISGTSAMREVRVLRTDNYATATFDFSDESTLDLSKIDRLIFSFNGAAYSFHTTARLQEIRAGTEANRMAYFGSIDDKDFYVNTIGCAILITDIQHTSHFVITGGSNLIKDISFHPVGPDMDSLMFDCIEGATGTDTIYLTAKGESGYDDYTVSFRLTISDNHPPSIDTVADTLCAVGEKMKIKLSGISDGNSAKEQKISVTAFTDKPGVITELSTVYQPPGHYGTLSFSAVSPDTATITIVVKDDGGGDQDSTASSFTVISYKSLNHPPFFDHPASRTVYNTLEKDTILLTGISDGDDGTQQLSFFVISSDTNVIPNPVQVVYEGGDTALLIFSPNHSVTGSSDLIITVSDNGGNEENNGDQSTTVTLPVETITPPSTGIVAALNPGDLTNGTWGFSNTYETQIVDSGTFKAIKAVCKDKFYWDGYIWRFPDVDIREHPYLSMEVYSEDVSTAHWIYFYDNTDTRNDLVNYDKKVWVPANKWTKVFFDFSGEKDLINQEKNTPIDASRISYVLFNMHDKAFTWPPPPNFSGTFYIRNIRLGDKAEVPEKTPVCSVDPVSAQAFFINSGEHRILLSGISNGKGSTTDTHIRAISSNTSILPNPAVGTVSPEGTATLTLQAGQTPGTANITLEVSAPLSDTFRFTFPVNIIRDDISGVTHITVNLNEKHQTIAGLGTMENKKEWVDLYARDMGATAVRIGILDNQVEPVNDNNDPEVLDMDNLNYHAFDWDYYRQLKEAGVKLFFLTVWSPPAWMKENLALDWFQASAESNTDNATNKLLPCYYEEFAEDMVAVVRMFKEEAGIDIYAIGLQNEPVFNEPYPSAILDPTHFARLISVVGKRFEKEGLQTKILMPEQVFSQFINPMSLYIDVLQQNEEANRYCDIIATHGYATDGIAPGQPDFSQWEKMWNNAREEPYPKQLWMSETNPTYKNWNSALGFAGALHGALWAGNISLWTNYDFDGVQLSLGEPTSTYYVSKQFYKFIRPGAIRVGSSSDNNNIMATAFMHPEDHTYCIELINKGTVPVAAELAGNNLPERYRVIRSSRYENFVEVDSVNNDLFILPPKSVTTLYATYNSPLCIDDVPDQFIPVNSPEQTIPLSGISDGHGGTSSLSLQVEVSDPSLIPEISVSPVATDGSAVLNYTPAENKTGTARVSLVLTGDTARREVVFYIVVHDVSDMPKKEAGTFRIHPNPVRGTLYIEIAEPSAKKLFITNISGKTVYAAEVDHLSTVTVNTSGFGKGLYIITLVGDKHTHKAKFVVW